MSGQSVLPTAETRPTDSRSGRGISAHIAECPYCPSEGTVSMTIQLCHNCGRWFEAIPEESESGVKEGGD